MSKAAEQTVLAGSWCSVGYGGAPFSAGPAATEVFSAVSRRRARKPSSVSARVRYVRWSSACAASASSCVRRASSRSRRAGIRSRNSSSESSASWYAVRRRVLAVVVRWSSSSTRARWAVAGCWPGATCRANRCVSLGHDDEAAKYAFIVREQEALLPEAILLDQQALQVREQADHGELADVARTVVGSLGEGVDHQHGAGRLVCEAWVLPMRTGEHAMRHVERLVVDRAPVDAGGRDRRLRRWPVRRLRLERDVVAWRGTAGLANDAPILQAMHDEPARRVKLDVRIRRTDPSSRRGLESSSANRESRRGTRRTHRRLSSRRNARRRRAP